MYSSYVALQACIAYPMQQELLCILLISPPSSPLLMWISQPFGLKQVFFGCRTTGRTYSLFSRCWFYPEITPAKFLAMGSHVYLRVQSFGYVLSIIPWFAGVNLNLGFKVLFFFKKNIAGCGIQTADFLLDCTTTMPPS